MISKILFIIPPRHFNQDNAISNRKFIVEFPYGLLSIIEYVEKYCRHNINTRILDLSTDKYQQMNFEQIKAVISEQIKEIQPDVVGVSILFNTEFKSAEYIANLVKESSKDLPVIVGGNCATLMYLEMLECKNIDAVCFGEGEIPWTDLANGNSVEETLFKHEAFITREKILKSLPPKAKLVENLDDIPSIDFTRVDINSYRTTRRSILYNNDENIDFPIITTRGCPYNCIFCTAGALHGKKVRYMSAERVIADALKLKEKFGATNINIMDDQALLYKERAKKILEGFRNFSLTPCFTNGVNIGLLDDEMIEYMAKANVKDLSLALESGSNFVLKKIIDKPLDIQKVPDIVRRLHKKNIAVQAFLVIGLPGETREHRQETIDFVKETEFDWVTISCAAPIRGSRLYDICVEKKYIQEDKLLQVGKKLSESLLNTPEFSSEEITGKAYLMNLELNFICNHNLIIKNYEFMLEKMDYILSKYPEHAFAYYVKALIYKEKNDAGKEKFNIEMVRKLLKGGNWQNYFNELNIKVSQI